MNLFTWNERLAADPRSLAVTTTARNGRSWVYTECSSSRACTALLASLHQWGSIKVTRRNRTSLWLEAEA